MINRKSKLEKVFYSLTYYVTPLFPLSHLLSQTYSIKFTRSSIYFFIIRSFSTQFTALYNRVVLGKVLKNFTDSVCALKTCQIKYYNEAGGVVGKN